LTATLLHRAVDEFLSPLRAAHEEQRSYLASPESRQFDTRTAVTLVTVAVMLILQQYVFQSSMLGEAIEFVSIALPPSTTQALQQLATDRQTMRLAHLSYWALGQVIVYLLIPSLVVKLVFRDKLSDYGLKLRGMFRGASMYVLMYLTIAGPVLWASTRPSFQQTYPFYHVEPSAPFWPRMILWELLYALQFVSLEFFFRGFMLHGCRRRFGAYAIFAMAVPYCMIHYHKPVLETFGAIAAGVILGYMSLRTRSIWFGAALHIAVAWTMDAAAIWQATSSHSS
jgi:membrane protease YdiL (CAAX protease family)